MELIAIIGLGPRGTSLLERLITHIFETKSQLSVEIFLFEKEQKFGTGCHRISLPKDLLTNTIAGQMTMYFGEEMKAYGPVHAGDSLYSWHRKNCNPDTKITDYLTRSSLGEYLHNFYLLQVSRMQENNIRFHQICDEVIDVISHDGSVEIYTKESKYVVNQSVLCIGHQESDQKENDRHEETLNYEYLEKIKKNRLVAIQGMGLTAFDIISRFTEGRGGCYKKISNTEKKYIPSGNEPKLHLFSRSGVFFAGRAFNPDHNFIYHPKYFTKKNIFSLRKKKELDFDDDILPLLKKELEYAYAVKSGGGEFDFELFFNPEKKLKKHTQQIFRKSFLSYLRWDIEQSAIGKMDSAYKFCQDVIRDLRDQFRFVIDYRGLKEESYRRFQSYWHPTFMKICVGPPYIRLMQLEALIKSGVCSIDYACNPQVIQRDKDYVLACDFETERKEIIVDHIIKARTPSIRMCDTPNSLTRNLLKRFKAFSVGGQQYGGLSITHNYEIMELDGKTCQNLYAFGIPSEGEKYFTLVLARPNIISTFLLDSNRLAKILLKNAFSDRKKFRSTQ